MNDDDDDDDVSAHLMTRVCICVQRAKSSRELIDEWARARPKQFARPKSRVENDTTPLDCCFVFLSLSRARFVVFYSWLTFISFSLVVRACERAAKERNSITWLRVAPLGRPSIHSFILSFSEQVDRSVNPNDGSKR